ncbi:MAG: NAD(P)-dependent oxidoreductase [Streptosporangiaceae bacterium]
MPPVFGSSPGTTPVRLARFPSDRSANLLTAVRLRADTSTSGWEVGGAPVRHQDDREIGRVMAESLGFAGIGIMGSGMSRNLLEAGFPLTVYNRTRARADALAADGAHCVSSPRELAERADVVFTCVSDTPDVEEVVLGDDGVIHGARPGSLVVDMSTISPAVTRRVADALAERQVGFLDAPISGGSEGAAQGTLSIMIGGTDANVERAMPYFQAMGRTITHVGPVGTGQTCKLVNQILVVVTMLGVGEALLLAEADGLDLDRVLDAVTAGAANSWMLANRGPQAVKRDWRPGFTIDLQQKDLRLVLEAAGQHGLAVPGTALVSQLYTALQRRDLGGEGNHALVKALEELSDFHLGERGRS